MPDGAPHDPKFSAAFGAEFSALLAWRRDVRRFRPDRVVPPTIDELIALTAFSPSVGHCQPTRFVSVESPERRSRIIANFETANSEALAAYADERAQIYAKLKLAGLKEAPTHLAVFCDEATELGQGLGARTMPETRSYSTVCAIYTFWLAARARGLGVGWVSILDPAPLAEWLAVPREWRFIAYLCVGWPEETSDVPELERAGWQSRVTPTLIAR